MNRVIIAIVFFLILGAGVLIGFFVRRQPPSNNVIVSNSSKNDQALNFINPTVTSNLDKHFIINFLPLKKQLVEIQKKYPQKTYVYFDYLNNASWVGLNERELFTAASTIKVPLAMSIYKMIEEGKLKTSDRYSLEELDLDENFGELYKVGSDKEFTVEELIKIMLEQSDNTAMKALNSILKKIGIDDPFSSVYSFMGWDIFPNLGEVVNYQKINLKTLSNMFISLYNAGYVSIENSNKILTFLSNTPFGDKIAAGVPEDIPVSHKIGISADDETFSDCGIVYAPNRNYILCLGSNGADEKRANQFMAEISRATYQFVINN